MNEGASMDPLSPWRAFVAEHDLQPDTSNACTWSGKIDGIETRLEVVPQSPTLAAVRVVVAVGSPDLVIGATAHVLSNHGRHLTGDPEFDACVQVRSPELAVQGVFDFDMRARLSELVAVGVHVVAGELVLPAWATLPSAQIQRVTATMLAVARDLLADDGRQMAKAIARMAVEDPVAGVRARCVAIGERWTPVRDALAKVVVAEDMVADDATFEALLGRIGDAELNQRTRLMILGQLFTLFPLARCVPALAPLADDLVVAKLLVRAFVRHLKTDAGALNETYALLARCLERVKGSVALDSNTLSTAARRVSQIGDPAGMQVLAVLAEDEDPSVFMAALSAMMSLPISASDVVGALSQRALSRAGTSVPNLFEVPPAGSGPLLAAFHAQRVWDTSTQLAYLRAFAKLSDMRFASIANDALDSESDAVVAEAIEALAAIGDASSVPRLRPLTSGIFRAGRVKERARAAIDSIRERIAVEAGALALADEGRGGLSLDES